MTQLYQSVIKKLYALNFDLSKIQDISPIVSTAIQDVLDYINFNISTTLDPLSIKDIVVDLSISNVLSILKNTNLIDTLDLPSIIKSISEGDVSITYASEKISSNEQKLQLLIDYFSQKKYLLNNFKSIRW